ncbi:MAG: hypothetical protein HFI38_04910 [Lachnospiraceae bacterium]|nr:hypothetical protein [Lachnospiraceae bacterium]
MKKKLMLMGITAALLFATIIGGSLAYFQANGDAVQNQITTRQLAIRLSQGSEAEQETAWEETARADGSMVLQLKEAVMPGSEVSKSVTVSNTADTELYTRVTVTRSWGQWEETTEGSQIYEFMKDTSLDGSKIGLLSGGEALDALTTGAVNGWIYDEEYSTGERLVFYYTSPLAPGEAAENLLDLLAIDPSLGNEYAGKAVELTVEADAIQMLSASDAALSEWGVVLHIGADGVITGIEN